MNSSRSLALIFYLILMLTQIEVSLAQSETKVGVLSAEEIMANDHIFKIYKERYKPDSGAVDYLSNYSDSLHIKVFFGNWCRESKKYIPGLMKTLEMAGNDKIDVEYVGVDVTKKSPKSFLNKYEIKYIPIVVVLKGRSEIERIVEKPHRLIETDLVQMVMKAEKKE